MAKKHQPPFFVLVYVGLQAFGGVEQKSKKNVFSLLHNTAGKLPSNFEIVGAADMARLAREAVAL